VNIIESAEYLHSAQPLTCWQRASSAEERVLAISEGRRRDASQIVSHAGTDPHLRSMSLCVHLCPGSRRAGNVCTHVDARMCVYVRACSCAFVRNCVFVWLHYDICKHITVGVCMHMLTYQTIIDYVDPRCEKL